MTIAKLMTKIVRTLPKLQGSAGRMKLSAQQLEQMAKGDKVAEKTVRHILANTENPVLEVAYKAEQNYAIAGMRLQDGKKVLGQGAVSLTNPGTPRSVVKYHLAGQNGNRANGFVDCGEYPNAADAAFSISRRQGVLTSDMEVAKAYAHHVKLNEQDMFDAARIYSNDSPIVRSSRDLQKGFEDAMAKIREALRGKQAPLDKKFAKEAIKKVDTKIAEKPLDFEKFKSFKDADFDKAFKNILAKENIPKEKISKISSEWLKELTKNAEKKVPKFPKIDDLT